MLDPAVHGLDEKIITSFILKKFSFLDPRVSSGSTVVQW